MPAARVGPLTRERRRELTRTALIEAAAELFASNGFHATSLEEIAHAAGFTRGAIYKNFKSKEDIMIAVIDWMMERQLAAYADALDEAEGSSSDRVAVAADVWSRAFRRDRNLNLLELELRLHAMRNPAFLGKLAAWERRQRERIAGFVEEQTKAAGISLTVAPSDIADLSIAGVEGLSMAASIHVDESEHYDRLVALFFKMVSETLVFQAAPSDKKQRKTRKG
ncbi:MAG: TetR/AcrR family transcriptional regulator [Actinomycetota bacterium]